MKTRLMNLLPVWRGTHGLPFDWLYRRETLTLNIEGSCVRILTTDGRRVTGWDSVPLAPGLVKDGLVVARSQVGSVVKTLLEGKRLSGKRVIASLSGMRSIPRLLSLPKIAPALVPEAIRHEAERQMPVPLDELYLYWRDMGNNGSERQFFAVGVPRTLLDAQIQTLSYAGIHAPVLYLKPIALARVVNRKEAVIIDLEQDNSDIVLVVDGIPRIMRTLVLRGEGITPEDKVRQVAAEVSRTVEFYNSSHPQHAIGSTTPVFLTGGLTRGNHLADLVRAALSNPVEEIDAGIECPADMSMSEYAVNIGLALQAAPRLATRVAIFPGWDLPIGPPRHKAGLRLTRIWFYMLLAVLSVALLFPAYQTKLEGDAQITSLQRELSTVRGQTEDARQVFDSANQMTEETSRLREGREAVLGADDSFTEMLNIFLVAVPSGVHLLSISMSADTTSLDGVSTNSSSVVDYAALLEGTGAFSAVQIVSLAMAGDGDGTGPVVFGIVVASK